MKLLLTSNGFANKTIVRAFSDIVKKPFKKTSLAFIPTAANVERDDKSWLVDDLNRCKKLGFSILDIVDISAVEKNIWEPRLKQADVLMFGGGNSFHLMYWLKKSGLSKILKELLKTRIYVGISAGSMITGKSLTLSQAERLYYEDVGQYKDEAGLGIVDFLIRPHLNSPHFPNVREAVLKEQAKEISYPIYALDDESAVLVDNGKEKVVSEGQYLVFNS